jgi:formylglycine-generating enzyme required for sulfatase activity
VGGRRLEDAGRPIATDAALSLEPGSYVLAAAAAGRYPTRLPVRLWRGQEERVDIVLPDVAAVPAGYAYVPAGTALLGAPDVEAVRQTLRAQPEHPVRVGAFLIATHEVTFAEFLEFLAELPPPEREARRPRADNLALGFAPDGAPVLTLGGVTARRGEPLCRLKRSVRRCQDWLRLPVAGISWDDAVAYTRWLAATGRVPGARLCTEREWERAARGADERRFPHGDERQPGDANFDATYGADGDRMGADEVGAYPLDRSPFGVMDLGGNVAEWVLETIDAARPAARVVRGGNWLNDSILTRAANRIISSALRDAGMGVRVCAVAPGTP